MTWAAASRALAVALGSAGLTAWWLWPGGPVDRPRPAQAPAPVGAPAARPDCPDTAPVQRRIEALETQIAVLSQLSAEPAPLPFPSWEWSPEALDAMLESWEAACPALAEAFVEVDCEEFPCLVYAYAPDDAEDGGVLCDGAPAVVRSGGWGSIGSQLGRETGVAFRFAPPGADHPERIRMDERFDAWNRKAVRAHVQDMAARGARGARVIE